MKVIASVQAGRSSSRGVVHYIAHSKIDGEKEPQGRQIFNEYTDQLEVEKANDYLKTGISSKRPENEELLHLVLSLKSKDFERLGKDEAERQQSLKEITRQAMKEVENEIGAESIYWAAGIHRNTENPHVHIALQKEYFDQNLETKTLSKLPPSLLPHYEKKDTGTRIFVEGRLINSATEKLEEIQFQQEKSQARSDQKSIAPHSQNQTLLIPNPTPKEMAKSDPNINDERDVLARAILARFYLDRSQEIVSSLENHGINKRFKIFDEITEKSRKMSLTDLERRAEKNADQIVKKQDLTNKPASEELKQKLVTEELATNEAGIKRIKTILHNLIRKENQNLRGREGEYKSVKPLAEKIKQNYRRQNRKLPIPNLTAEQLEMLQNHALENKDFRAAAYFERVRREKSVENGTPTRTGAEISRLKAKQEIIGLKIKLQERNLADFRTQKRTLPIEINGKRYTLQKIDSLIRNKNKEEQKIAGKVVKALGKIGLIKSEDKITFLNETKVIINEKLNEKNDSLEKGLGDEKSLLKTLNDFYFNETNPDKETIKAKFSATELAEVESLSFTLKLPEVYQDNWNHQKRMFETSSGNDQPDHDEIKKRNKLVAGRALAREVLAGIEVNRANDELTSFKKYQTFQKFEVKDDRTDKSKFVSLSEVGLTQTGSILDQTLEYFLESREIRRMRRCVEKQIKAKHTELKDNIKAANSLLQTAREAAAEFKTNSFLSKNDVPYVPLFTPKELVTIELRVLQTTDNAEAKNLQKILNSLDPSQTENLSVMLQVFDRKNDSEKSLNQHSSNEQKAEREVEKVDDISLEKALTIQEKKAEVIEPDRGR
ncbi:MAG TPA: relaxase MobL [Pyrinomonadaceae bacterium]|nr:relaxase MobL [Pyrinomonadaceae bacterium]